MAEASTIKEILVLGPTRSSKEIVYNQLPFSEGDIWQEEYRELVKKRLAALEIFNPMELRIITEPASDNTVRVIIRATDTSIYYIEPVEFVIFKTTGLASHQVEHVFRNPFGNGYNIEAGFNWSKNP